MILGAGPNPGMEDRRGVGFRGQQIACVCVARGRWWRRGAVDRTPRSAGEERGKGHATEVEGRKEGEEEEGEGAGGRGRRWEQTGGIIPQRGGGGGGAGYCRDQQDNRGVRTSGPSGSTATNRWLSEVKVLRRPSAFPECIKRQCIHACAGKRRDILLGVPFSHLFFHWKS